MKHMRHLATAAIITLGAALLAPAAHAETAPVSPTVSPEAPTTIDISNYYIDPAVDLSGTFVAVDENGTEYTATISGDTATIAPDSTTEARAALAAGCSRTNFIFPLGAGVQESVDGCGLIGVNSSATHTYQWDVDAASDGQAAVEGRGYKPVGQPGDFTYQPYWSGLGRGGGGSGTVTIGEVIRLIVIEGVVGV
ncbi:hypothetical protein C5D07_04600 [Rathayibacter tritici]|uniref:hypothetical protein n=1 Tax=Rathayibacter tritici TaxID=33888 RepID=UPI000CE7FDB5|nr:hypothetical protein [Rathayibacter tritici]PPF22263.1 hypothetical protein C5C06_14835 [Rathayibacter tritici]PPI17565.1 hypothetical protein C5D07_04600 [Rathayibacter tritici]